MGQLNSFTQKTPVCVPCDTILTVSPRLPVNKVFICHCTDVYCGPNLPHRKDALKSLTARGKTLLVGWSADASVSLSRRQEGERVVVKWVWS